MMPAVGLARAYAEHNAMTLQPGIFSLLREGGFSKR